VRVDGVVELRKTCKIRSGQRVTVGDVLIEVVAA
jgi:ribosome-associated protein